MKVTTISPVSKSAFACLGPRGSFSALKDVHTVTRVFTYNRWLVMLSTTTLCRRSSASYFHRRMGY